MYFIGFDSYPTGPKMRATMEVYWWWWLYQILSIPERFPERLKRVTPEWDINQWLEPFLTQVLGSDSRKPKTCLVEPRIADTSCNKRGSLSHFWGWGVDRIWKTPATRESVLGGYFPNNQDYELYDVNVTQESEQCNRLEGSNLDLWEIVRTSDDPMSLQCIGGAKCIWNEPSRTLVWEHVSCTVGRQKKIHPLVNKHSYWKWP